MEEDKITYGLKKLVGGKRPTICPDCQLNYEYMGGGHYQCKKCGREEVDDFGKVKDYLDENGATSMFTLEKETGVKRAVMREFIEMGRLEIAGDTVKKII